MDTASINDLIVRRETLLWAIKRIEKRHGSYITLDYRRMIESLSDEASVLYKKIDDALSPPEKD